MTIRKFLGICAGIAGLLGLMASASAQQQLVIGTMGQGSAGYSAGAAVAKVLTDNGLPASVRPSTGTTSYMPLIESGEIDLGIANGIEVGQAVRGEAGFAGNALKDLGIVARLYPLRVGVLVKADSNINNFDDLKGKRLTYGYVSQTTIKNILDGLLAAGDISPDDIKPVSVPNVLRGADEFAAGKADAFFFAVGSGKVAEIDASVGGVRYLPVDDTPEAAKRLQALVPESYIETIQPADHLVGVSQPMGVMAYDQTLLAGKHLSDETVQKVIDILRNNKEALQETFASFREMDPDNLHGSSNLPYLESAKKAVANSSK